MKRSPFFMIGLILAVIIVILAIAAPWIVQYDPIMTDLGNRFATPEGFSNGLSGHVLGTDALGRDVFSRLMMGARYSLFVAFVSALVCSVLGTVLGLISGYKGGFIDTFIMRICEVFSSIPGMILAIAIVAMLGASMGNLILVMCISGWVIYCRITRNNVLVLRNMEFVSASRLLGAGTGHIVFKQILPNVLTPLIIQVSQQFGFFIIMESGLSFLNLGIAAPTPSWGNMISDCRQYLTVYPHLVIAPGIALMLTVLAFTFLGDGVRDVLDPKKI